MRRYVINNSYYPVGSVLKGETLTEPKLVSASFEASEDKRINKLRNIYKVHKFINLSNNLRAIIDDPLLDSFEPAFTNFMRTCSTQISAINIMYKYLLCESEYNSISPASHTRLHLIVRTHKFNKRKEKLEAYKNAYLSSRGDLDAEVNERKVNYLKRLKINLPLLQSATDKEIVNCALTFHAPVEDAFAIMQNMIMDIRKFKREFYQDILDIVNYELDALQVELTAREQKALIRASA